MRDIGVRTAMVQWVFITALTLVSALALALVYGLGGVCAARAAGAGRVVALALLLTRLYAPLTALASARVEVMSALVSFERVFEVLDLKPLIDEKPEPPAGARRAGVGRVRPDVRFGYPSADKVSLASLEEVAKLDTRGGVEVLHDVSFRASRGRWWRWSARPAPASRRSPSCCRGSTTWTPARCGCPAWTSAT